MKGDPCPARENKSCQVGFTDKRYRCVCRDGYRHRKYPTDQSDQCVGKIESKETITHCSSTVMPKQQPYVYLFLCRKPSVK